MDQISKFNNFFGIIGALLVNHTDNSFKVNTEIKRRGHALLHTANFS